MDGSAFADPFGSPFQRGGRSDTGFIPATPGKALATEAVDAIAQRGFIALAERAKFVREAVLQDGRIDPDGHPSRTILFVRRNAAGTSLRSANPSAKGRAEVIPDLRDTILDTWRTNNRVTVFFVEHLPPELLAAAIPGAPRRTIRMIIGHLHNARCMWIKTLGQELGVTVPRGVDRRRAGRKELVPALERSSRGILRLLTLGCEQGGKVPLASSYIWRNLPLDVGHVLAYFVAHEAHHRGQIVWAARALGYRLPPAVTNGLWQWTKRAAEVRSRP